MSKSVWSKPKGATHVEEIVTQPVGDVHVDAAVLMRIVKHTQECVNANTYSIGYILGLDIDGRLEVTEAVPLPAKHDQDDSGADESSKAAEDKHQRDMLEHLVQVTNFDNYHVGVYHSTYMGYFYADALVDMLLEFQKREGLSKNSIALMYDHFQTSNGGLFLRALRLSNKYIEMRKQNRNDFMPANEILEALPVRITGNALAAGLMRCLRDSVRTSSASAAAEVLDTFSRLDMRSNDDAMLIRYMEEMANGAEEVIRLQYDWARYAKSVNKTRREHIDAVAEAVRRDVPLTLDSINQELSMDLKPLAAAPPRLGPLLATAQLDQHAQQTTAHIEESMVRLYATRALHTSQQPSSNTGSN